MAPIILRPARAVSNVFQQAFLESGALLLATSYPINTLTVLGRNIFSFGVHFESLVVKN